MKVKVKDHMVLVTGLNLKVRCILPSPETKVWTQNASALINMTGSSDSSQTST